MKIEKAEIFHLRMPLKGAFETSFGRSVTRDCILVLLAADGIEGVGECVADWDAGYSYETVGTAWHIYQEFIFPLLKDVHINHPEEFQKLTSGIRGHRMAKAGVEMALWDIFGKQQNKSLKEMIGGVKDRVEVGVSVGIQETPDELVETVRGYVNQGYTRVKLKIKPGKDVEFVQAVRSEFPALRLQVDANSAYTLDTAQALLPLDDMDLLLIEQPLDEEDLWDHHILQKSFNTPICLDESVVSILHARQAIEMGSCRIINIKAGRVGGISQAVRIHDHCLAHNVPVWCGGMLETGVGRASNLALASLPGFTLPGDISATERYYEQDITVERFQLNPDSTINVPTGAGLGVSLDWKAVEKYTLNHQNVMNFVK